ncbi:MAG: DegV family protein [Anaerolineae bacterium]|nr:DegV family protein [Anaerolineae bacterium]
MQKVIVVTDSTANLPPEVAAQYQVPTIPLTVHWGEDTYLDGVTLDAEMFYRWLQVRKAFPTTSQPSSGAFVEFFKEVAERYQTDTILGIFISSDLSGTLASATQARAELPDLKIELVDSRFVSMGAGFQVVEATQMAQAGASVEEIVARLRRIQARAGIIFAVDTLEYLHRGGRIGGAARLLGTALNLKPVLALAHGRVEALEKVRSRKKSLRRVLELVEERLEGQPPAAMAILLTAEDEETAYVRAQMQEQFNPKYLYTCMLTPVVGTHSGPGTIGIAFYR